MTEKKTRRRKITVGGFKESRGGNRCSAIQGRDDPKTQEKKVFTNGFQS